MIRSMTGFGSASATADSVDLSLELRSVNSRHLKLHFRLPPGTERWEEALREEIAAQVRRGHVDVTLRMGVPTGEAGGGAPVYQLDEARAGAHIEALRDLQERWGLGGEVDIALVQSGLLSRNVTGLESVCSVFLEPVLVAYRTELDERDPDWGLEGKRIGVFRFLVDREDADQHGDEADALGQLGLVEGEPFDPSQRVGSDEGQPKPEPVREGSHDQLQQRRDPCRQPVVFPDVPYPRHSRFHPGWRKPKSCCLD